MKKKAAPKDQQPEVVNLYDQNQGVQDEEQNSDDEKKDERDELKEQRRLSKMSK